MRALNTSFWNTITPHRFRDARLEDFNAATQAQAEEWLGSLYGDEDAENDCCHGPNVVIAGPVGTGKTRRLAFALSHRLLTCGYPSPWAEKWRFESLRLAYAAYWPVVDLVNDLRIDPQQRHEVKDVQLLLLDDVGANRATDHALDLLFEVVNDRSAKQRPILSTTNLHYDAMCEHVGELITSRLCDGASIIRVVGGNRRGNGNY